MHFYALYVAEGIEGGGESGFRIFLPQIDGFGCGFLTQKKYGFADSGCGCGLPTLAWNKNYID